MTGNRRVDYQQLCEQFYSSDDNLVKSQLQSAILELVVDDEDYAKGFIEDTLNLGLRWLSPTVGKNKDRPFTLTVEMHSQKDGSTVAIIGAAFKPKIGDDIENLTNNLGEEIYGLSKAKGFDWLIEELAVNGKSIAKP